jgi:hypothetical protein
MTKQPAPTEDARPARREVPWLAHIAVVVLVVGGFAVALPPLLPVIGGTLATFAALSTAMFPIFRRSWAWFFLNYPVSAAIALVLRFR